MMTRQAVTETLNYLNSRVMEIEESAIRLSSRNTNRTSDVKPRDSVPNSMQATSPRDYNDDRDNPFNQVSTLSSRAKPENVFRTFDED